MGKVSKGLFSHMNTSFIQGWHHRRELPEVQGRHAEGDPGAGAG